MPLAIPATLALALGLVVGCGAPPQSQFPDAQAAIDRMRATQACSRGLSGDSKVDYFGDRGRLRGNTLFILSRPERLRISVYSPFGVTLSTITSNGKDFALLDVSQREFWHGPANACNASRFLSVPAPLQSANARS